MENGKDNTKEIVKRIEDNFEILDECQKMLEEIVLISNITDKEEK
ncbi:MAG TPA: hypothetical protein PK993_02235 [Clostridia bacterium]|nr:hypothetical protein [Clostridia bacterium]